MREKKWTSAPWSVCGKGDCSCGVISSADHPICIVESGEWGDIIPTLVPVGTKIEGIFKATMEKIVYGTIDPEEARANCTIIAAAPDLVEALEACAESLALCRDALGMCGHGDGRDRKADVEDIWGTDNALTAARQALARAYGEKG